MNAENFLIDTMVSIKSIIIVVLDLLFYFKTYFVFVLVFNVQKYQVAIGNNFFFNSELVDK